MIGDRTIGQETTEHQSVFPEGHQDWRPGSQCQECWDLRDGRMARHGIPPLFTGIEKMKDRDYASVHALEKEAIADARAAGITPERA